MTITEKNEKLLDEMCERIYKIIDSRDIESYQYLLNLITLTIEAIAEMFKDVTSIELVNSIQKRIEHDIKYGIFEGGDEQEGGDICEASFSKY